MNIKNTGKHLIAAVCVTLGLVSTPYAAIIGDAGINTQIIAGVGGPYRVQGEALIGGQSWWEDGYILQGFAINHQGLSSAYLSGGGFAGCEGGMICQLTETGDSTDPSTGNPSLQVQGFMIKKQDNSNFTLKSLSVLPNGFNPHIEGSSVHDTQLFIGTTFDRYRPLAESMDSYSMGALYLPRQYRDFNLSNAYADVNELFIFTSTDTFWSSLELNDVAVSSVPIPSALWLFLSGIGGLLAIRKST